MEINEITYNVIGCAMKVHSALGNGFQELVYQRALAIEMEYQGVKFVREKKMEIFYREILVGTRRVDFFVEDRVMVELKAVSELLPAHKAQAINYLEVYKVETGLLINFGKTSLDFHRVYNKKFVNPENQKNPV